MNPEWLLIVASPFVGSFLGVLVVRLPQRQPVVLGRSACSTCGVRIASHELIPILSWLVQKGRCRSCGTPLGYIYPAIELSATIAALWSVWVMDGVQAVAGCMLGWALLALAFIDWRHLRLPDAITLPLLPLGLLVAFLSAPETFWDHAIGAALGLLFFFTVRVAYFKMRGREGLGLGDVKLLGSAGAWVGWMGLPWVVLIAAFAALTATALQSIGGSELSAAKKVPFGVYLAAGTWLVWLYGPLALVQ
ncbi:MAG: A24 family peptidase [Hyphomicrobiales bacterium]|nr:A24 family peptidase [Hyphomicrobiales bacterium]